MINYIADIQGIPVSFKYHQLIQNQLSDSDVTNILFSVLGREPANENFEAMDL